MAWIKLIEEDEADGDLRELYRQHADRNGKVGGVIKAGCWNVPALAARMNLFKTVMYRREGLSRAERELIAVVTSVANQCEY